MNKIVTQLKKNQNLSDDLLIQLLKTSAWDGDLYTAADSVRREQYGTAVYLRGLIEFTNICRNNCYYCGIRRDNPNLHRYRLTQDEILSCCTEGYRLGYRTFVLQGGEDPGFSNQKLCAIVSRIRETFPDCAITLSVGDRSKENYRALYQAGANRYLLRHETADEAHYRKLHPMEMSLENRKRCLYFLKEIGFQVGSGFMVGSPYQTVEHLIADLRFLQELQPDMIGIGPFLTQYDTPFKPFSNGSFQMTLRLVAVLRLMFPYALIPSTTALSTIHPQGREMGLQAGANVVMPNLSPISVRKWYALYEGKRSSGGESAQQLELLRKKIESVGYHAVVDRGDVISHNHAK